MRSSARQQENDLKKNNFNNINNSNENGEMMTNENIENKSLRTPDLNEHKEGHRCWETLSESSSLPTIISNMVKNNELKQINDSSLIITNHLCLDKKFEFSAAMNLLNTSEEVHKVAEEKHKQELNERTSHAMNLAPKDISYKHYERLIEELKCPGCAFPMKSPIYLCMSGHSICEQCTRILVLCPLCKETFTNMRSRTVEALCSKAQFKCSNFAGGCTVRLQIDLLPWHEKQCIFKPLKCFMGRVWGDCQWSGREAYWKNHLEIEHSNKIFFSDCANLVFDMRTKNKALSGYYVFQVHDEMFNFYEVYDKDRLLFTMTCSSTQRAKKYQFAYEVSIMHHENNALAITHKLPVNSEYDTDILAEGTCVNICLNDLTKFIDHNKFVHYYVKILKVISPMHSRLCSGSKSQNLPLDFKQTKIQGVNLKSVASDIILTRHLGDNTTDNNTNSENTLNGVEKEFIEKFAKYKQTISGSHRDPEFGAFYNKKWSAPQLSFNSKYLKANTSDISPTGCGSKADTFAEGR